MNFETLSAALDDPDREGRDEQRAFLASAHAADIAAFLKDKDPKADWQVFDLLSLARQAELIGYLQRHRQVALARTAPRARLAAIVTRMNADERADLFNALTRQERENLLPALAQAEREDVRRLTSYREETAGSIMTSAYAVILPDQTCAEALETLRREAPDKETIHRAYVVDAERRLLGSVRLQDLVLADPGASVRSVMERDPHAVPVTADQEEAARDVARYDLAALPVIDEDGRIVGIITHDDALDVLTEEATEDIHKSGSVAGLAQDVGRAGVMLLYRARVFWLVLLVFGNIFSGAGIAQFEDTIAQNMALLFFLPLLIASGGNAGAQASTLTVRAMATGEIELGQWGRLLAREIAVAGLLGITMALAIYGIGLWRGGTDIAMVVALSMIVIVLMGSLVGLTLPFVLIRFGFDPATASGPLVTSIADIAGVLIYLGIAHLVLF